MGAPNNCIACPLHQYRTNVVNGVVVGETPELLVVGEGPGIQEDIQGRPFVGATGHYLAQELQSRGITSYALSNATRCYPSENKKDSEMQAGIQACVPYLLQDIEDVKPTVILALGAWALKALGITDPISTVLCHILDGPKNIPLIPSYHPAAFMREPGSIHLFNLAVLKVKLLLKGIRYGERWEPQILTLEQFKQHVNHRH